MHKLLSFVGKRCKILLASIVFWAGPFNSGLSTIFKAVYFEPTMHMCGLASLLTFWGQVGMTAHSWLVVIGWQVSCDLWWSWCGLNMLMDIHTAMWSTVTCSSSTGSHSLLPLQDLPMMPPPFRSSCDGNKHSRRVAKSGLLHIHHKQLQIMNGMICAVTGASNNTIGLILDNTMSTQIISPKSTQDWLYIPGRTSLSNSDSYTDE